MGKYVSRFSILLFLLVLAIAFAACTANKSLRGGLPNYTYEMCISGILYYVDRSMKTPVFKENGDLQKCEIRIL